MDESTKTVVEPEIVGAPPKKQNTVLWIIIIVVLLLLLCCCAIIIGVAWFLWAFGDAILYPGSVMIFLPG